jgi:predicted small lipoprotein YifL
MFKRICWGNWIFLFMVVGLFSVTMLSGCGNTGELYLPDTDTTETTKDKKKTN